MLPIHWLWDALAVIGLVTVIFALLGIGGALWIRSSPERTKP